MGSDNPSKAIVDDHEIQRKGKVWLIDGKALVTAQQLRIFEALKKEGLDPLEWQSGSVWCTALTKHKARGHLDYLVATEIGERRLSETPVGRSKYDYRFSYSNLVANTPEIAQLINRSGLATECVTTPPKEPRRAKKRGRAKKSKPAAWDRLAEAVSRAYQNQWINSDELKAICESERIHWTNVSRAVHRGLLESAPLTPEYRKVFWPGRGKYKLKYRVLPPVKAKTPAKPSPEPSPEAALEPVADLAGKIANEESAVERLKQEIRLLNLKNERKKLEAELKDLQKK